MEISNWEFFVMLNWKIKDKVEMKSVDLDIHPIALQLLFQRGIDTQEKIKKFLVPDYERDIHDPFLFSQMQKVIRRIEEALGKKEKVAIFGDYDADGVTSTVVLKETFDELGIDSLVYIPDKRLEGYGLNIQAVEELGEKNVKLIITVDCGITNLKEVERANEKGMDVVIVDHHHVPEELPSAFAIVNPHFEKSGYPFSYLAGVGVVFKVVQALYQQFLPEKQEQTKWLLDLVALGTVADCVPLLDENRTIVAYGLVVLSKTRRVGLKELFAVGRIFIDENNIPDARKISFQIAPRINAAGRMDHANTAYNLLAEKNQVKARSLALELEASNQKRQQETERVAEEVRILANNMFKNKKFIFAVGEHFPIGTAGLVAGKIAEEFNKPTAVLQKEEKVSRGSFRSIPGINIIEKLEECRNLLIKCGGHHQAAGITVANDKLDEFYEKLNRLIKKELEGKECVSEIKADAKLTAADIDFELAENLMKFAPFGEGNPQPVFLMEKVVIGEIRPVGTNGQHMKLFLRSCDGSPKIFEAIGFNLNKKFSHLKEGNTVDIIFNLEVDSWNGNKKIQLKLVDLKVSQRKSTT